MAKQKDKKPGSVEDMLDKIRKAISECNEPEKVVYEELESEAEGWKERLRELDEEDEDE